MARPSESPTRVRLRRSLQMTIRVLTGAWEHTHTAFSWISMSSSGTIVAQGQHSVRLSSNNPGTESVCEPSSQLLVPVLTKEATDHWVGFTKLPSPAVAT